MKFFGFESLVQFSIKKFNFFEFLLKQISKFFSKTFVTSVQKFALKKKTLVISVPLYL
jgi:hypothetical protein